MSDPLLLTLLLALSTLVPLAKVLLGGAETLDPRAAALVTSPASNAG